MTISFNIPDAAGDKFLLAARWKVPNNGALNDNQVMNRYLKICIGALIDEYNKDQAITADREALRTLQQQVLDAQAALIQKKNDYDAANPPTELDP